jgi:hypothetical protein
VLDVVDEWGFTSKLSYFVMDNATNNNGMIRSLSLGRYGHLLSIVRRLSKLAVNILSIPAMSAEPERLFSGAGITITDRRNRLGSDVIEALECLKSWFGIQDFRGDEACVEAV